MSAKKQRGTRVPTAPPKESEKQKASSFDQMDSPNLSSIDKASFLAGLQLNYGNPLHSTAMEEDLNVSEEKQMSQERAGRTDFPKTGKDTGKQRGAAVKRKKAEGGQENEEEEKKINRGRRRAGEKVKRPEKEATEDERAESDAEAHKSIPTKVSHPASRARQQRLVGKKPAKRGSARPVNNQQRTEDKKRRSQSGSGKSNDSQSQDSGPAPQRHRRVLSSDEEEVDEDTSWIPSPKKSRMHSLGRTKKSLSNKSKARKSSSGSASGEPGQASTGKQRRKKLSQHVGTELEVVLDSFLDFCDQYRESVESKAVRQAIDCFSNNVKEQLLEKITSLKELKVLKRDNIKVGSLIRKNTQRLYDAKHELMRAERQAWLLGKEKAELQLRLADLRRSQAFLHDIRELNRQYLDYRHKHPKEKEMYGASSLAALLLETKHIETAENQLRGINIQQEKRQKKKETGEKTHAQKQKV
ncbi:centromere protein U isoform X2 [Archocentrus centrarchus]|uniref:centromere protein U isoform X2 n=1 Tax=Archocentrus centrarchus TaxID=63155 RepID=UPI0011EA192B|nr:centromere protein U-like isoform X2 [Archocentrus centrarchus]